MYTDLIHELSSFMRTEDIRRQEPMKNHTSFRVGGPAGLFLSIRSGEILSGVLAGLNERKLPYFILGNGSNLLVSDQGYEGVILYLEKEFSTICVKDNIIEAGAAALLSRVAASALEAGLTGLEFASGIPGSMGGGSVMNAGAYGGELGQVIKSITAMDEKGKIHHLDNGQLEFGYRNSIFKRKKYVILKVIIELEKGNKSEIKQRMEQYNQSRREKQPLEFPSAGSTFKRPKGYYAGKLIMDAGLRGCMIGGAQVSEKHCGFIINRQNATASDILALMNKVRQTVKANSGIELEPEVICLGE